MVYLSCVFCEYEQLINVIHQLRIRFPPCPPSRDKSSKLKREINAKGKQPPSNRPASGDSVADSGIFDNYTSRYACISKLSYVFEYIGGIGISLYQI